MNRPDRPHSRLTLALYTAVIAVPSAASAQLVLHTPVEEGGESAPVGIQGSGVTVTKLGTRYEITKNGAPGACKWDEKARDFNYVSGIAGKPAIESGMKTPDFAEIESGFSRIEGKLDGSWTPEDTQKPKLAAREYLAKAAHVFDECVTETGASSSSPFSPPLPPLGPEQAHISSQPGAGAGDEATGAHVTNLPIYGRPIDIPPNIRLIPVTYTERDLPSQVIADGGNIVVTFSNPVKSTNSSPPFQQPPSVVAYDPASERSCWLTGKDQAAMRGPSANTAVITDRVDAGVMGELMMIIPAAYNNPGGTEAGMLRQVLDATLSSDCFRSKADGPGAQPKKHLIKPG